MFLSNCRLWCYSQQMYFRVEQLIVLLPICVMMSLDKNWNVATTERVSGQEDSTAMFGRPISYSRHTLFRYRRCHAVGMSKSTYIDILTECGLLRYRGTRGGQAARARREARLRSKPEVNRSVEKPAFTSISDQIGLMAGNNNHHSPRKLRSTVTAVQLQPR